MLQPYVVNFGNSVVTSELLGQPCKSPISPSSLLHVVNKLFKLSDNQHKHVLLTACWQICFKLLDRFTPKMLMSTVLWLFSGWFNWLTLLNGRIGNGNRLCINVVCICFLFRTLLFNHCESNEEGTRNVVAECLGKLTLIDPTTLLGQLQVQSTV